MPTSFLRSFLPLAFLCGLFSVGFAQQDEQESTPPVNAARQKTVEQTPTDDWVEVAPEGAAAKVRMPGTPVASQRTMSPVAGTTTTVNLNVLQVTPTTSYVFAYNIVPRKPGEGLKADNVLDGGVKGAVARTLGDLISAKKIEFGKFPGRDFTFECIHGETDAAIRLRITSRLILIGDTLYQMTYVTRADEHKEADAKKFVESFSQ